MKLFSKMLPFPKWISVKDRLPEESEDNYNVIHYWVVKDGHVFTAHFYHGEFTNLDTWYDSDNKVTHWMPAESPVFNEEKFKSKIKTYFNALKIMRGK